MIKGQFDKMVYGVLACVPSGKVTTYGSIARALGMPRSSRIVAYSLHRNPEPGVIACHRVVMKDGSMASGFAFGGGDAQRKLLEIEGISFTDGCVDMTRHFCDVAKAHDRT